MSNRSVRSIRRGDLARATGCNLETIRYYEKIGIMPDPPRNTKGYRSYDDAHVRRLKFVMRSRDLGFTLEEVRGLLGLVDEQSRTCAEVQVIAEDHLTDVRAKIADLKRIERVLSDTVARCTGDAAPECAVIDALLEA
ncbi:helix-turn-helix domain-containing protein [uncultured Sulfitobacter sp.]|uniref:MerR family transcriptional regulator n=1 Tax=uncultured Sulfitobacter sp. TaxID=191468 RepID=UPI0026124139|nr:helix-turn-helix domain-containing protein [uncultured Sulfitobacter sp.]